MISCSYSFHTQTFAYPESSAEREEILQGLRSRIEDIKSVSVNTKIPTVWFLTDECCFHIHAYFLLPQVLSQTESYLQQLLMRAMAVLPQWKVRVQKCKAVQMVLNLCSSSVTEKCLIAEAWCPTAKLPELQSALREGGVGQPKAAQTCRCRPGVIRTPPPPFFFWFSFFYLAHQRKSGSGVDSFYNRLATSTPPPTLFPLNSFTTGFQNIVDAYGVASYREVNPGGTVHF